VDISVVIFQPIQVVFDFFVRFKVPLLNTSSVTINNAGEPANASLPAAIFNTIQRDADFQNGSTVIRNLQSQKEETEAFQRLAAILSTYPYLPEEI